jgi:hypothetical protein
MCIGEVSDLIGGERRRRHSMREGLEEKWWSSLVFALVECEVW